MKFFYLAHGNMSLTCLKKLAGKGYIPGFAVIHKDYEREKLEEEFYKPMESFCKENDIQLYSAAKLNELSYEMVSCETGICVGFMEILKKDVLGLPKFGILNLHCGKLPKYRGRAPISRTIINDEPFLTITLHKMDEGVDSGDILCEMEIPVDDEDNARTLYEKASEFSGDLVMKGLNSLDSGNFEYTKQDTTNFPANRKLSETERRINWNAGVKDIYNLIRALVPPYPGAITRLDGKDYVIAGAELLEYGENSDDVIGVIKEAGLENILVMCKDGILKINEILDGEGQIVSNIIFNEGDKFGE
jgi:methionyl-tRNA formyltransferase